MDPADRDQEEVPPDPGAELRGPAHPARGEGLREEAPHLARGVAQAEEDRHRRHQVGAERRLTTSSIRTTLHGSSL